VRWFRRGRDAPKAADIFAAEFLLPREERLVK